MVSVQQLFELQEIDLGLDSRREALQGVVSHLGESEELQAARSALQEAEKGLRELETDQRDRELEAEAVRSKARALETRLYGGTVRSPKELRSLQEEAQALKKHQREVEDQALDLMLRVEAAAAERDARRRERNAMEQQWRQEQERLGQEKARLESEIAEGEKRRQVLARNLDGSALQTYEELRLFKQGRAVARVERGMCSGCRIDLPQSDLRRARLPQVLASCSNCGRILYVG